MFFGNKYKLQQLVRLQKLFLISIFSFDNFFSFQKEKKKKGKGFCNTVGLEMGENLFKICRNLKENLE